MTPTATSSHHPWAAVVNAVTRLRALTAATGSGPVRRAVVRQHEGALDDRDVAARAQVIQRPAARRGQPWLLVRLWAAGAGPADFAAPLRIDLDSTIVAVHGRAKRGAAFGYTKVRGYHPQLATCAQTGQVLMGRLRGGSAGAARGAASLLTETVSRVRAAGAHGQLTVRADSAFYSKTVLSTAAKFDVRFSVTGRQDRRIRAAIEAVPDDAFTAWHFHAFVTDRNGDVLGIEGDHSRRAVVEQSIAELKSTGPGPHAVGQLHG